MKFDPVTAKRVVEFERLTELRWLRTERNKINSRISFLESLLGLKANECPTAERLVEMFGRSPSGPGCCRCAVEPVVSSKASIPNAGGDNVAV
jgi:hypothetical protein